MVIADDQVQRPDERELLARARAGEARAFCLLIAPLQARLWRQAASLANDLALGEDLVAETLVEAWKGLPRFNESCRLSTWLYAILLNRYRKSIRRARCRPLSLAWLPFVDAEELHEKQANLPAPGPSPVEVLTQNETAVRLRECLDRLPEKHRQVILLRYFEDASLPDMAAVLGCSTGTVKSRLFHALDKLRKMKMNLSLEPGDQQT